MAGRLWPARSPILQNCARVQCRIFCIGVDDSGGLSAEFGVCAGAGPAPLGQFNAGNGPSSCDFARGFALKAYDWESEAFSAPEAARRWLLAVVAHPPILNSMGGNCGTIFAQGFPRDLRIYSHGILTKLAPVIQSGDLRAIAGNGQLGGLNQMFRCLVETTCLRVLSLPFSRKLVF